MQAFMPMLITYSIVISVVILFYMVITPLLSKRYSARGLYYTWLVIVIGLVVPFRPQIGVTVDRIKVPVETSLINMTDVVPYITRLPVSTVTQINNTIARPVSPNIEWWQIAATVWIAGVLALLSYYFLKHHRFIKMVNRWSESVTEEKILALMGRIKGDLGITREIHLSLCPYVSSPMMIGFLKPRLLLPTTCYSDNELYFIIKHELVHYRRKDLWHKCLMLFATAVHWFNPVVYLMAKAVNNQCELSCDAEVVSSTNTDTRQHYCEMLLEVMKNQSRINTAISTNFNGGKKRMKKRISSIMDMSKKKAGLAVICIILIVTAGIGIASAAANSDNNGSAGNMNSDVFIRLRDYNDMCGNYSTSVCNVDSRPKLEFYIEGDDIAQIEVTSGNEYLYAVDWTETQHEKYWNVEYYQTFDEETQTCTVYPERRYDKSVKMVFDEGFDDYGDIWYRWYPWNLFQWASEDNYSRYLNSKVEVSDDMTDEQKLKLAAGDDGSGTTGIGHIQLDGYPEELTEDLITITITDREGNSVTKYIDVKVSNDELNQTVVTAEVKK